MTELNIEDGWFWADEALDYLQESQFRTVLGSAFSKASEVSLQAPIQIDNLMKHGVNNLVFLLEIFLCRVPFVSFHYQASFWHLATKSVTVIIGNGQK